MTLTVGVLHGCRQSAKTMMNFMKKWHNIATKLDIKLIFIEGFYPYPPLVDEVVPQEQPRMWLGQRFEIPDLGVKDPDINLVKTSCNKLHKIIKIHNIEALIGFSQGANLAYSYTLSDLTPQIKALVLLGGYMHPFEQYVKNNLPIYVGHAKDDPIVPYEMGQKFTGLIDMDLSGHRVPSKPAQARNILNWLVHHANNTTT